MSDKEKQAARTLVGAIDPTCCSSPFGKDPVLDLELAEWDCIAPPRM